MGIPDHLTCLLKNLYAGQEATVRTGHGTTGWFQIWKGVHQGCLLSPCLFNFYAEYIKQNAGLDTSQARIKIAGRNNNLKYADESESESHSVLSDSLQPHGLNSRWNSPGQNTGMGRLLQGIFQTQELNRGLLHCRWILYQLSY